MLDKSVASLKKGLASAPINLAAFGRSLKGFKWLFNIRLGLPEMESIMERPSTRKQQGKLDKNEEKFFKKLVKSPRLSV